VRGRSPPVGHPRNQSRKRVCEAERPQRAPHRCAPTALRLRPQSGERARRMLPRKGQRALRIGRSPCSAAIDASGRKARRYACRLTQTRYPSRRVGWPNGLSGNRTLRLIAEFGMQKNSNNSATFDTRPRVFHVGMSPKIKLTKGERAPASLQDFENREGHHDVCKFGRPRVRLDDGRNPMRAHNRTTRLHQRCRISCLAGQGATCAELVANPKNHGCPSAPSPERRLADTARLQTRGE